MQFEIVGVESVEVKIAAIWSSKAFSQGDWFFHVFKQQMVNWLQLGLSTEK